MRRFKRWLTAHANDKKFVVTSVPFIAQPRTSKDKWSNYRKQREEIIDHLFTKDVRRLVFLCGDQHNSHYATLRVTDGVKTHNYHELMSSPVNQIQKSRFSDYVSPYTETADSGVSYTSRLLSENFYNEHSNAMTVTVDGDQVTWRIFRTKSRRAGMSEKTFTM